MLGLHHSTACKDDELTATIFSLVSTTQLFEVTYTHIHTHIHIHTHTHTHIIKYKHKTNEKEAWKTKIPRENKASKHNSILNNRRGDNSRKMAISKINCALITTAKNEESQVP